MADSLSTKQLDELNWRKKITFAQRSAIESAGLLALRALGEQIAHFEPIESLDGEPIPQTMDEAFVLLRRLADRTDLSPHGVLLAFVAGDLAGSVAAEAFPAVLLHRVEGKGVSPPADEPRRGKTSDEVFDSLESKHAAVPRMNELGVLISQTVDGALELLRPDGVRLALTEQEVALIRALPPFPDPQSTVACELSWRRLSSTFGSDTNA